MAKIVLGHPEAHEKLTARLFWRKKGENGFNDAGNVREYVDATTRSLVTRVTARNGARFVNDEQADLTHEAYTFLLDELPPEQQQILKQARVLTATEQNDTEGATATLSDVVEGRWHEIGAYNIANVVVTGLGGTLIEGTDYEVDKENGRLRVIPDAGIAEGEDLTVTFDQPGMDLERIESQYDPLFHCDVIIELHNQHHRMWLQRAAFSATVNATEFPSHTGEFGTYRFKVTPTGPVTWMKRHEAQTLPEHGETGAPANSSSSSSNSSSSSGHSSSSSSS
jgi:hypothetical protein